MARTDSEGGKGVLAAVLTAATTVLLAVALVAAGLAACCFRPTTELLAQSTSADELSPYSRDTLVALALVTRDYTVDGIGRADVLGPIADAVRAADPSMIADSSDPEAALAATPESYTLTADALDHLDDVYGVISTAAPILAGCALAALAGIVALWFLAGKRRVAFVLIAAPVAVIAVFAALAAWVLVDFNGFFAAFHSLFFANGTWTFAYDSLLICMYPPDFWIGMGAVWLAATTLSCAVALLIGFVVKGKRNKRA